MKLIPLFQKKQKCHKPQLKLKIFKTVEPPATIDNFNDWIKNIQHEKNKVQSIFFAPTV